jgi:hypothetical protein
MQRFYIYATNNKNNLDFVAGVSACTLASPESKPGYQRSVGQVFACYGLRRIFSKSSCGILQAFSITTTGIFRQNLSC